MGLGGTTGPWRGAYETVSFATSSIGAGTGTLGTVKNVIFRYIPINDIVIPSNGIQIFAGVPGTNTRINIEANGSSILSNSVNSAASMGVGLATGNAIFATVSDGVGFGNLSNDVVPPLGTFIKAGTVLQATASSVTASRDIMGNMKFYNVSHATSVRNTTFE